MNPINHVAIILDGNGRWGIKNRKSRNLGHKVGLITVEKIVKATIRKNIKYLTLYVFSTENWKRPKKEVSFLFNLLEDFLIKKTIKLNKNNIKLKIIGDIKPFSIKLKKILINSEKITNDNKKLQINLALNYGSRGEIVNSAKLIKKKKIPCTLKNIEKNLYTANIPDPELVIRTGNTNRLSNFLLWQAAYAEIFFVKKLWPEFLVSDYYKILNKFKNLKRNFGALK
jgi:undecaprenyl diphosphate synthase